ncbi:MAG: DUF362 domain-containing protein [Thermoguttaceae bacterium]|nr:DUF362 domain-containing protein [Thermoguttaceae bacterium]
MKMTRHEFLKAVAFGGLSTTLATLGEISLLAQEGAAKGKPVDLVALLGGEPAPMFEKGIDALGGIERFVKKGDRVTIKPNICWDRRPELAVSTNPELIGAIVRACKDAGAQEVVVFDNTCGNWRACYELSGIEEATKKAGGVMAQGNEQRYYREVALPKGVVLKSALVHQAILDCDVWFNVPILKNHGGAKMTIAMKNLMGIVWDRREFHRKGLDQCIADIGTIDKPATLNIVDAYRIMKTNGPRGLNESDVELAKALIMSTDPVAVDVASTKFFNQFVEMPLSNVKYLDMGEKLQLGTTNLDNLVQERVRL